MTSFRVGWLSEIVGYSDMANNKNHSSKKITSAICDVVLRSLRPASHINNLWRKTHQDLVVRAFSRALSSVTVLILISHWLITITLFALIGQCDDFSLASTTRYHNALFSGETWPKIILTYLPTQCRSCPQWLCVEIVGSCLRQQ